MNKNHPARGARRSAAAAALALASALALAALAGCGPQAPSGDGGGAAGGQKEDAPITASFSMDADCGACHAEEQASTADASCLASVHAGQNAECTTCHADEASLAKAHDGAAADSKMPTRLKRTKVENEACLSCHSGEDRVAATAGSTVCTDSEGTVVNPHDLPATSDHESILCADCHSEHTATSADEQAPKECLSCHHADVYQCHTCHD